MQPRNNPFDAGGINFKNRFAATIYNPDGLNPAAGAKVLIFRTGLTDTTAVARYTTDELGRFEIVNIPAGTYNLLAEKDSFVLLQNFRVESSTPVTLHDDTLECPSSLSGTVSLEKSHNPCSLTVQLPGTGKYAVIADTTGRFTLGGLSSGTWVLLIGCTSNRYQVVSVPVEIARCTSIVMVDTIRLGRRCTKEGFAGTIPSIGGYRVFYGDLHNHTGISDGSGTPIDAYNYARNRAGFDFFAVSDHCMNLSEDNWEVIKAAAGVSNEDSAFVALWGFEWSSSTYGHCTVIATEDYCTVLDTATDSFTELCAWLSARDGIAFFNHPNRSGSYYEFNRFSDTPCDRFVGMELWNKSDDFSVYYYNDGLFPNDNNKSCFDEALWRGWKIGAAGAGDNHSASWGDAVDARVAVLAHKCTRDSILAAFKNRRFYSTLDKNLMLSFAIDGNEMGSTVIGCRHKIRILAEDADGERFREIVLYNMKHDAVRVWLLDTCVIDISYDYIAEADDYCYIVIRQKDGDEAISSPLWISCAKQ